jgi:uncharacterized C2H2 Zn-finger protein
MTYNCVACKYISDDYSNYIRHTSTKRHISKNPNTPILEKIEVIENMNTVNKCRYCGMLFAQQAGLSRHKRKCDDKDDIIKENHFLTEKIKLLMEQLIEYKDDKNSFKNIAVVSTKTSSNALSFVMSNYSKAPVIQSFNNFALIQVGNEKRTVADIILHHYKKKDLVIFLSNIAIKEYKKDSPDNQSVWNTDATRSAYILRESRRSDVDGVDNSDNEADEGIWITDKGGIKTAIYIIKPLLDHVKVDIVRYLEESKPKFKNGDTSITLNDMINSQIIINDIESGQLSKEIIKYLSIYFYLDKKSIKLITDKSKLTKNNKIIDKTKLTKNNKIIDKK